MSLFLDRIAYSNSDAVVEIITHFIFIYSFYMYVHSFCMFVHVERYNEFVFDLVYCLLEYTCKHTKLRAINYTGSKGRKD